MKGGVEILIHEMKLGLNTLVLPVTREYGKSKKRFEARGNTVIYSLNGEERPPTKELRWDIKDATGDQPGWL